MPICAFTVQAAMVIPDCSLLVTTFSRQSWPLQRTATRVTSMMSFVGGGITRLVKSMQTSCQHGRGHRILPGVRQAGIHSGRRYIAARTAAPNGHAVGELRSKPAGNTRRV